MATSTTIVIPARLASTRFPEKVLADRTGRPLVQHVVEAAGRSALARAGAEIVVAADDERIAAALRPYGTRVLLTRVDHPNGTSRLAEAARLLGLAQDAVIVNAQGDEPEMEGEVLDQAAAALTQSQRASVGTVAAPLAAGEDGRDPNIVKVVRDLSGHALYFSRAPIPIDRDSTGSVPHLRHIGVYVYRRAFLERYLALPQTPLERAEQLEQLRVLEHGHAIAVAIVATARPGIDTPAQYDAFVKRWNSGPAARQ